ncbi:MAG: hypothetical protein ACETVN_02495, partial [Asgard group archaeon]
MILPFILLTIAYLTRERNIYAFSIAPGLLIGVSICLFGSVEMVMTNFGWSYTTSSFLFLLQLLVLFGYTIAIIIASVILLKKQKLSSLRNKILIILGAFVSFQVIIMLVTNALLVQNPNFPPFGGILSLLTFLFITYAISLPTGKIEVLHSKNMKKFSEDYLRFLNKLLEVGPGKELGENLVKFKYHLPTLGLSDVIEFKREKISFRPEPKLDLGEVTDKNLDFMKQRGWTLSAVKPFTDVFVDTYEAMKSQSKKDADEWFERMLRKHGAFLYKHGILDAMPEGARIPGIFRE